jgi:hypothetical protein
MLGERVKLQFEEELEAGRQTPARGRPQEFSEEQDAGQRTAARVVGYFDCSNRRRSISSADLRSSPRSRMLANALQRG